MKNINDITNRLFGGDNLEWLKEFPSESVDLIYLDPPFRTNRDFKINDDETEEIRGFEDKNKTFGDGTMKGYINVISLRLKELRRILKPTGSIYLHCDPHASHYLKIEMDERFGVENFKNEIIWKRMSGAKSISKFSFSNSHDIIFFYTKSNISIFNKLYLPLSDIYIKNFYTKKDDSGRIYRGAGGNRPKHYKYYLDESKGVPIEDLWMDINNIQGMSKECLGYNTQKPEALLERIIKSSSNENDIVLDPYCGSGTTLAVAKNLNRKFIGIDHSPQTCKITSQRLFIPQENIIILQTDFFNKDERYETMDEIENNLKKLSPERFQEWVCQKLEFSNTGNPDKPSGADGGKDGIKYYQSKDYTGFVYLEVKSGESGIGIDAVKKMYTTLNLDKVKRVVMVGFSYTNTAYQTANDLSKNGISINLYTAMDILKVIHSKMEGSVESLLKLKHESYKDKQVRFT